MRNLQFYVSGKRPIATAIPISSRYVFLRMSSFYGPGLHPQYETCLSALTKLYLKESSAETRPLHFGLNVIQSFVMSHSLSAVEFGGTYGGMKLVNNGSCDGLVPDGDSPLLDSSSIQCAFIITPLIIYSFIYLFLSFVIIHRSIAYLLVP